MTIATQQISRSIVKLRGVVPENAFTAGILGSERLGSGVVIDSDGLILTIGYLIAEATDVWLTVNPGRLVAGHALAYDQVTGFGLVLPLERLNVPPLEFGSSAGIRVGDRVRVFSSPELAKHQVAQVIARREFAGAWEYLLAEAIFTAPAHPHWSGSALIDNDGKLLGLGSLLVRESIGGEETNANMFVPIDDLKPILAELKTGGRARRQARPWLGVYAVEVNDRIYVTGAAEGSPAQAADLREGDFISHVGDRAVSTLAEFYRHLWSRGPAGVTVPLTIQRGRSTLPIVLHSVDRNDLLKRPQPN